MLDVSYTNDKDVRVSEEEGKRKFCISSLNIREAVISPNIWSSSVVMTSQYHHIKISSSSANFRLFLQQIVCLKLSLSPFFQYFFIVLKINNFLSRSPDGRRSNSRVERLN